MRRRAELVDETRLRITEAAVRLHTTVGPSNTTITTVAEEAGVTRLTVYRHFADLDELFDACRRHWYVQHPPPDSAPWREIPDLRARARRAFTEFYGWFRDHGQDLFPIYRDMAWMPRGTQEQIRAQWTAVADDLVAGFEVDPAAGSRLRAAAGHLIHLMTWRSLVVDQGLDQDAAIELAVRFLVASAESR